MSQSDQCHLQLNRRPVDQRILEPATGELQGENLASIREAGCHWLVAATQQERVCYHEQFEEQEGWREILREPSPRNEGQQKMRVLLKPAHSPDGSQSVALCWSQGRTEKDRAIHQRQEIRFLADVQKLRKRSAARGAPVKLPLPCGTFRPHLGRVSPPKFRHFISALRRAAAESLRMGLAGLTGVSIHLQSAGTCCGRLPNSA